MEETRELSQREQLNAARSLLEKMKRLIEDQDYLALCAHMQAKLDTKVQLVFFRPTNSDSELLNLYTRGEIAGWRDAMDFAKLLISGAESDVQMLEMLQEQEVANKEEGVS